MDQALYTVRVFNLSKPNREPTRGLEPLTCSLRVIGSGVAGVCRELQLPHFRGVSFLCLAACCTVLRSRWYQSGIKFALPSACTDGGLKNRKYGLSRLCHLRKRVNIEEQARVPQNPREYVDPLGRAANLALSVYDLRGEGAGIEVRYEPTNLATIDLKDAYALVGDSLTVRGTLGGPLQAAPSSVAKTFRNVDFISPKVLRYSVQNSRSPS